MKLYNQDRTQELNINTLDLNTGLIYDTGEQDKDTGEMIATFVPFTERELTERKIAELKQQLADTDYKAVKFAEGEIPEYEYVSVKIQRRVWREEINTLEEKLKNLF